jgi:hypothetical protein
VAVLEFSGNWPDLAPSTPAAARLIDHTTPADLR